MTLGFDKKFACLLSLFDHAPSPPAPSASHALSMTVCQMQVAGHCLSLRRLVTVGGQRALQVACER
jgi:hypothetical protein